MEVRYIDIDIIVCRKIVSPRILLPSTILGKPLVGSLTSTSLLTAARFSSRVGSGLELFDGEIQP